MAADKPGEAISTSEDFYRASGECVCSICGKQFYDHPMDRDELAYDDQPYLHILCNGDRVKL